MSDQMPTPVGKWKLVRTGDHRWFHDTVSMSELRFHPDGDITVHAMAEHIRMAATLITGEELTWMLTHRAWLLTQPDADVSRR